ncbi:glycogen/starch synthase [Proteiniphilum sp. UBA1028]|jgi:glycosyltransferase involved in cell wall biosynthesis|uniref:glycogen/starch synthase n=1 Tax=Proteiniphilum sp. UBA1028 TaxID=1947251 RepID=UPI000E9561C1|nr:glycogen/starch synthase [Proteiniphilum sp. UBA1028]HBG57448.1 glycosyl transferase [Porphyromonadaceae bacterium]
MEIDSRHIPRYIFETSWEVCNKVGGIYTVLSTRARSLQQLYKDRIFFIGPDIWKERESPWFTEDRSLYSSWCDYALETQHLEIRAGRWNVPGEPIVFLVKFEQFLERQNEIYAKMWTDYEVDSIFAYGDYFNSTMFAYATGLLIESFYRFHHLESDNVIAHFNEWMLGAGALYIKKYVPKIATMFTTHATSIGRSIAGNNLPLYNHLKEYNGDQMARQLNMVAKHSIEKEAARNVDCFTTVSEITARECAQFLQRQPEVVTPNGFEKDFIPKGNEYIQARKNARKVLLNVAEKTLGYAVHHDALLIGISGRYEFKNKGIDVFIEAMNLLRTMPQLTKDIVAFIMVPGWISGPRKDLQALLSKNGSPTEHDSPAGSPFVTHNLVDPQHDAVMNQLRHYGFSNTKGNSVKIIFVPSYLNGDDGIFNLSYYDLLIGLDLSVFPSYYEPWGYTPHESVAFSIPTITTSLSGFGVWAKRQGEHKGLDDGIEVIHRDDYNHAEVAEEIASIIYDFSLKSIEQIKMLKQAAGRLSDQADWSHFIEYYQEAYGKALHNSFIRLSKQHKLKAD